MVYDSAPKPRQKSCTGCKSAKRRCDLAYPACSRCVERRVICVYHGRPPPVSMNITPERSSTTGLSQDLWQPVAPPTSIGEYFTTTQQYSLDDMHELIESQFNDFDHSLQDSLLSVLDDLQSPSDYELSLTRARARPPRPLSEILASRLQFSIDAFKDAPRMMVMENQMPWCHPHLYKTCMPKSMQDAYMCSSLYLSKNEINAPVVMNLFDGKIADLLASPLPDTLPEVLARVHALLLYQIMRLFDGDVRFHGRVDSLFLELESSVLTLIPFLYLPLPSDSMEPLPVSMESISEFWKSWILQESARRTVLVTYFFTRVYKTLRGTPNMTCDGKLGLNHSWYLSSHLWKAQSAFDFAVAWAERPHYIVENLNMAWVMGNAQPNDLDVFGKMILVTLLGIDDAKAWFYTRGSLL